MSAADELAANVRRIQARDVRPPAGEEPPGEPRRGPAAKDTVRQTFDLTRAEHHRLSLWRLETAYSREQQLTMQDLMTAAVRALLDDEQVARRVRAQLDRDLST